MEVILLVAVVVLAYKLSDAARRIGALEAAMARLIREKAQAEKVAAAPPPQPAPSAELDFRAPPAAQAAARHEDQAHVWPDTTPGVAPVPSPMPVAAPRPDVATHHDPASTGRVTAPASSIPSLSPDLASAPSGRPLMELLKRNLFAVAGVGLLLLGFAFLLGSIQWGQLLPPWARVGLAWAAAGGLGVLGLRLSGRKPIWAQIAQGGAAGIAYLATYVGSTHYGLIGQPVALVIFAALSLALVLRAMAEDSKVLAAVGFLGAYAGPVLALSHGGGLGFNLGYGLLVSAFALWVSYRRRWLEIAVHAHLCAGGLAAITYFSGAEPLAAWVQQVYLHAYLAQLLAWTLAWSRTGEGDAREDSVLIACMSLTALSYLGLQSWLLETTRFCAAALGLALLYGVLGVSGLARRPLREAAWVIGALSLTAAIMRSDLRQAAQGLGLFIEGVFLGLTAARPASVRAWLSRALVALAALVLLPTQDTWTLGILGVSCTALALWRSRAGEFDASVSKIDHLDGWVYTVLSVLVLPPLIQTLNLDVEQALSLGVSLALVQAGVGVACLRRGAWPAPLSYGLAAGTGWLALALYPGQAHAGLQIVILLGALAALVVAARALVPRVEDARATAIVSVANGLVMLVPALLDYKLHGGGLRVYALMVLAGCAHAWLLSTQGLHRLWRLDDECRIGDTLALLAHALALAGMGTLGGLDLEPSSSGMFFAAAAYFAVWLVWMRAGEGVDDQVRKVLASAMLIVGAYIWWVALNEAPGVAMDRAASSHLLPVLLAAVGVSHLFRSSQLARRQAWMAAAAVCVLAMIKLLLSLGSALLSPLGIAGSLLAMGALFLLAGYLAPLPPAEGEG